MTTISDHWSTIQEGLFPHLEELLGALSKKHCQLITVIEMSGISKFIQNSFGEVGRPLKNRRAIATSYIAKSVYNTATTAMLIDRLKSDSVLRRICGFERGCDIPSESTFSRAFSEFSKNHLAEKVHDAFIKDYHSERLVGHISRDSTKIEAREKPVKKVFKTKVSEKRGRPKKGECRPEKNQKRLEKQPSQSLDEMLAELPTACDIGRKVNSKGHGHRWAGYKLHTDVADGGITISTLLTSASLHDSQVAIPLAKITYQRVTNLYDLMDSAYDCPSIREHSRSLGHIDIIDHNKRRGQKINLSPAEATRYHERSTVERSYGRLKDDFGGGWIRVRGHAKVFTHLMFAIIALNVEQTVRMLC